MKEDGCSRINHSVRQMEQNLNFILKPCSSYKLRYGNTTQQT